MRTAPRSWTSAYGGLVYDAPSSSSSSYQSEDEQSVGDDEQYEEGLSPKGLAESRSLWGGGYSRRWSLLGAFILICATAGLAVFFIQPGGQTVLSTLIFKKIVETETETEETTEEAVTVYAATDTLEFGFQRSNYDLLTYWGSSASEVVTYKFLEKYDMLIEPNVDMHLKYIGDDMIDDGSGDYYTFSVKDMRSSEEVDAGYYYFSSSSNKKSSVANIQCKPFEEFRVSLTRYDAQNNELLSFDLMAVCMYVRRELRSLSAEDLNKTMDAMYTMWSTSDLEGQEKYGTGYHSAEWFAGLHDFNAAWSDGDHIHEGLGFLPQHIKMSNAFEQSMQAVDPSVSLFYWDFTIESTLELSFYNSPMFTADTFGSLTKSVYDGTAAQWSYEHDSISDGFIPDGRWAQIPAYLNKFALLKSPYGYMRGPWNTNPASKITRFSSDNLLIENIPSCRNYLSWLQDMDYSSFLSTSENAPHASIHGGIGGVFGCNVLDELYDQGLVGADPSGTDYRDDICYKWPFYMKELYRGNLLFMREDCTTDEGLSYDGSSCGYDCNSARIDEIPGVLAGLSLANYVAYNNDSVWQTFSDFICTGNGWRIFSGDHLESASPADPSFWPIHPTQERLYQAKLMAGGFNSWTWPNETGQSTPKVTYSWVCNHAECYDWSEPSFTADKDYFESCCDGHFEGSQLFDHTVGDREEKYGSTNKEIFEATDPTSDRYSMPYIFDSFEWDHCASHTNYDIRSEIERLYYDNSTSLPTMAPTKEPTMEPTFNPTYSPLRISRSSHGKSKGDK